MKNFLEEQLYSYHWSSTLLRNLTWVNWYTTWAPRCLLICTLLHYYQRCYCWSPCLTSTYYSGRLKPTPQRSTGDQDCHSPLLLQSPLPPLSLLGNLWKTIQPITDDQILLPLSPHKATLTPFSHCEWCKCSSLSNFSRLAILSWPPQSYKCRSYSSISGWQSILTTRFCMIVEYTQTRVKISSKLTHLNIKWLIKECSGE